MKLEEQRHMREREERQMRNSRDSLGEILKKSKIEILKKH